MLTINNQLDMDILVRKEFYRLTTWSIRNHT